MAIRRILELGDEFLYRVSEPVRPEDAAPILQDLEDTLGEFRRTHGYGRGISAIQIGEAKRIIFLNVEGRRYELINPTYSYRSQATFLIWDDCFSFSGLMARVRRHCRLGLRYQDRTGMWQELDADEALSELIQHEMDHLDGILAVQRAEGPGSLMLRSEWERQGRPSA